MEQQMTNPTQERIERDERARRVHFRGYLDLRQPDGSSRTFSVYAGMNSLGCPEVLLVPGEAPHFPVR